MSRLATNGARSAEPLVDDGEICPVCKTSRYLSKHMRFLINPECYHKMCESCVDRIFSHGPAPCPVAGCKRTLRKGKFRKLQFSDLAIEREVDIRGRLAKIFNRTEGDFETLRDYNDYLGEVEDMTFNLINGVDVEETQRRIETYQAANKDDIAENAQLEEGQKRDFVARQAAEQEMAKQRREAATREAMDEKRQRLEGQHDIINRLASGTGDARKIAFNGRKAAQARANARTEQAQTAPTTTTNGSASSISFAGLKKKTVAEPEQPYDPFGGYHVESSRYIVQDDYSYEWFELAKKDSQFSTGGYRLKEFYSRALADAFSGLGVFISDEVGRRGQSVDATIGTESAAVAASSSGSMLDTKMSGDDVF